MSYHFKMFVLDEGQTHFQEKEDHDKDEIQFEFDGVTYKGNTKLSWKKERGLFRKRYEHWLIFYKSTPAKLKESKKTWVDPVLPPDDAQMIKGSDKTQGSQFQFITADLLFKIKRYRGVNPAFKDEFKLDRQWDVPQWAIIPVLIILIAVSVGILWRVGALDDIMRSFR